MQAEVENSHWSSEILSSDKGVGQYTVGTKINSEIGYGFTLSEECRKFELYSGYEFDAQSDDELLLGISISIGSNLNLDLERTRKLSSSETEAINCQFYTYFSW